MRCKVVIDPEREEEIIVYAKTRSELVERIERLAAEESRELFGYGEKEILRILPSEVTCFVVECNKVYALIGTERIRLKQRLYELEPLLDSCFVKINQSCIANIGHIKRFDASVSGGLAILFENGYRDYVSRRQLKIVKERIGLKK